MRAIFFCNLVALMACFLHPALGVAADATTTAAPTGAPEASPAANQAWEELLKSSEPPQPPDAWRTRRPSAEEIDKFKASEAERLSNAAAKAREFQKRFLSDPRAVEAGSKEYELLQMAAQLGNTNVFNRLDAIEEVRLKDATISNDERFQIRTVAINRQASRKMGEGQAAAAAEFEKGVRQLIKEFPKRPEPYQMLLEVASDSEPSKAEDLLKLIFASSASDEVKQAAHGLAKKLERIGKPVPIQFTAIDGRSVDLAKLHGKVVLVDFWATWCGPCVKEIPNVLAAYEKLHPKGFEIVGISFDDNKERLQSFVQQQKMSWPQYFDGKKWDNDYGKKFGIDSIPNMWLVDKKGNLRDLNGREDLADKVDKLLAETP